jgi:hypothetical protein
MEKRRSQRLKVNLKAERISGDETHGIFIENISENGIHIITAHMKENTKYFPGREVDLKLFLSSGGVLRLRCKVKWSCPEVPPENLTDSIGLEIIDPPLKYIEFIKTLHNI